MQHPSLAIYLRHSFIQDYDHVIIPFREQEPKLPGADKTLVVHLREQLQRARYHQGAYRVYLRSASHSPRILLVSKQMFQLHQILARKSRMCSGASL